MDGQMVSYMLTDGRLYHKRYPAATQPQKDRPKTTSPSLRGPKLL